MKTTKKLFMAMLLLIFLSQVYAQNDSIKISGTIKGLGNRSVWISFSDASGLSRSYKSSANDDNFSVNVPKQKKVTSAKLNISVVQKTKTNQKKAIAQGVLKLLISNQDIRISGEASNLQMAKIGYIN